MLMTGMILLDKIVKHLYCWIMETKEDLVKDVTWQILRIFNKHSQIEAHAIRFDEDVVMTPREIHTIQVIGEHRGMNITEVADNFGVTKSAASQMVARLADKGFVNKRQAGHSNKEVELDLTELGCKAFYAHERFHARHIADIVNRLGAFTLSQVAAAAAVLEVIESVVDDRLSEDWLLRIDGETSE